MDKNDVILDNKTIAKLAITIAIAKSLDESGESIGALTRKVLETLDSIDSMGHFNDYNPKN